MEKRLEISEVEVPPATPAPQELAMVYTAPNDEVLKIGARYGGVSVEVAKTIWNAMIANAQPTIIDGKEPHPLALNGRAIATLNALEGRDPNFMNMRWIGYRPSPKPEVLRGGFLRDRLY